MIEFRQPTSEDILSIEPQPHQCEPTAISGGREVLERGLVVLDGRSMAIFDEGKCIGVYGATELWPGVARLWGLFSEDVISKYPEMLCMHAKRDLERVTQRFGFHRVEATVNLDHVVAREFLEWLGFECEGLMRRYTMAREDMYLYAKVCDGMG